MRLKKVIAFVLCVCMLASLVIIDAGATGNVAQIGPENQYATLADAVSHATAGQTVKLISSTDISATGLSIDKEITLDLGGYTITASNTADGNIKVASSGDLTLIDTGEDGSICTNSNYSSSASYGLIEVSGSFAMDSGYINAVRENAASCGQFAVVTIGTGSSVTINGGKIEAGWFAISGNGDPAKAKDTVIEINDGELISTADYAIYHPTTGGTLTVNGGKISGLAGGIAMNNGTLTITGGSIESKGTGDTGDWGDGTGNLSNSAISLNAKYGPVTATVSDTMLTASGNAIAVTTNPANTITLNPVNDSTLVVSSVASFKSALTTITGGSGNTIKLGQSITSPTTAIFYDINTSVTLELNGYTLSGLTYGGNAKTYFIKIGNGAILTVRDSSSEKSGTISASYNANSQLFVIYVLDGSKLILDSGTITNGMSPYPAANINLEKGTASFEMNGGTVRGVNPAANKSITAVNLAYTGPTFTMNNGTITSEGTAVNNYGTFIMNNGTITVTGTRAAIGGNMGTDKSIEIINGTLTGTTILSSPQNNYVTISGGTFNGAVKTTSTGNASITGGNFNGTVTGKTGAHYISGGYFTTDVGVYTAAEYTAVYGSWLIGGVTYNYTVSPVPELKITSASTSVYNGTTLVSSEESSVTIANTTLMVSGMISAGNKITVTYTMTDGLTGKFDITSNASGEFSMAQKNITVGSTTYYINISGLSIIPEDVTLAVNAPVAEADTDGKTPEQQAAMTAAASAINGSPDVKASGLVSAATDIIDTDASGNVSIPTKTSQGDSLVVTQTTAEQALTNSQIDTDGKDVKIVVESYLDIQVSDYTVGEGSATLELDITPMYSVKATVASGDEAMTEDNTVSIGKPQELETTAPITITIPVTVDFASVIDTNNIYIKHEKAGTTHYYKGTYANGTITFTDPNGFSKFTLQSDSRKGTIKYGELGSATYTLSDLGKVLPTPYEEGKTFKGWRINGTIYTDGKMTSALLTAINGASYTAEAVFEEWDNPFVDVSSGSWYYAHVHYAWTYDLFYGTSDTTFSPDVPMTRGMLVTVLYKMAGRPVVPSSNIFPDVSASSYYHDAVIWAYDNNIVSGYDNGNFGPDDKVTREQAVVILMHFAAVKNIDVSNTDNAEAASFSDYISTSSYARDAMSWAVNEDILNGDNGKLLPQGFATRAQVASILRSFSENILA